MTKKMLILTVGLPRSGKTTWSRKQGFPIVNPDSIRLALHGKKFEQLAEPMVWAIAKIMVRSLFMAGHKKVILDATNCTIKRRNDWTDSDWFTVCKIIDTSEAECIKRAEKENDQEIIPVIKIMRSQYDGLLSSEFNYDEESNHD